MIYQQASLSINATIENAWNYLKKAMTTNELKQVFPDCSHLEIRSDSEGKIFRSMIFSDRVDEEIIVVNFINHRINCIMQNDPNYYGEISYSLLKPSEQFLAEKYCTLVVISAWRMHPAVFAAPSLDKSEFINQVANNLKLEMEKAAITVI